MENKNVTAWKTREIIGELAGYLQQDVYTRNLKILNSLNQERYNVTVSTALEGIIYIHKIIAN